MLRFKEGDRVQVVREIGPFNTGRVGVVADIQKHIFFRSLDEFTVRLADGNRGRFFQSQLAEAPKRYAALLHDSSQSIPSGARGSAGTRSLLFQSDGVDVALFTSPMRPANRVLGQISARSEEMKAIPRWHVFVIIDDETIQSARTDTFGEFSFKDVPDGNITIEVLLPSVRLLSSLRIAERRFLIP